MHLNMINDLFFPKLAKKSKRKVFAKTDEDYISVDLGYSKALHMFRSFHPLS